MVGESHQKEQANLQWDRLDMEGHSLINKILTAETKKVEWPDNAEPIHKKENSKRHQDGLQLQNKEVHLQ